MARGRKNTMETVNKRLDFVLSLMVQFLPGIKALEEYEDWTANEYTEDGALSREQFYADQKAVLKRCKKDAENEDLSEQHAFFIKALEFNVSENYRGNQSQSATNAIAQIAKLKGLVKEETIRRTFVSISIVSFPSASDILTMYKSVLLKLACFF